MPEYSRFGRTAGRDRQSRQVRIPLETRPGREAQDISIFKIVKEDSLI